MAIVAYFSCPQIVFYSICYEIQYNVIKHKQTSSSEVLDTSCNYTIQKICPIRPLLLSSRHSSLVSLYNYDVDFLSYEKLLNLESLM